MESDRGLLEDVVVDYNPNGIPVIWTSNKGFGRLAGKIVGQFPFLSGPNALFIVDLDRPIPFDEYTGQVKVRSENRMALLDTFSARGCLDDEQRVTCIHPMWMDLEVQPVEDVLVQYETEEGDLYGAVDRISDDGTVVYLRSFRPDHREDPIQIVPIDRFAPGVFRPIRMELVYPNWGLVEVPKEWVDMPVRELLDRLDEFLHEIDE